MQLPRTICFDCDSTLSAIEGVDEMARHKGVLEEIRPLTHAAMEGLMPLDAVYGFRLKHIAPTALDVAWLGARYVEAVVADAAAVVAALQREGVDVRIVSGGLRQAILPLAKVVGIPPFLVHAVEIYFDGEGNYVDYDRTSPLARNAGKGEFYRTMGLDRESVHVGDGFSDLEVRGSGVRVVGFGGVVRRAVVESKADLYLPGPHLAGLLPLLGFPPLG